LIERVKHYDRSVEHSICPICLSGGRVRHRNVTDALLGHPGNWNVFACSECDAHWLDPRPTNLGSYYAGYMTQETYKPSVRSTAWLSRFARRMFPTPISAAQSKRRYELAKEPRPGERPSVLDIGCGNGGNLAALAAAGWSVSGHDLDPIAAANASKLLGVDVKTGPLSELHFDETFDVVMTSHVIEHVEDLRELMGTTMRLVRPGGRVLHYTPNGSCLQHQMLGRKWRGLEPPRHLVILGPESARRLFEDSGFSNVKVTTCGADAFHVVAQSFGVRGRVVVLWQIIEDIVGLLRPNRRWELVVEARRP
jgi:SAM-dependent methyltransferase